MFEREYHAIPEDFELAQPIPAAHRRFFWPAVSAVLIAALLISDAVHTQREVALETQIKEMKSVLEPQPAVRPCTPHQEIPAADTAVIWACNWTTYTGT